MPIDHEIDRDNQVLIVRSSGIMVAEEFVGFVSSMLGDPQTQGLFKTLIDLTEVERFTFSVEVLMRVARLVQEAGRVRPSRTAIVASSEHADAFANMYRQLQDENVEQVSLFSTVSEAMRWLALPVDQEA